MGRVTHRRPRRLARHETRAGRGPGRGHTETVNEEHLEVPANDGTAVSTPSVPDAGHLGPSTGIVLAGTPIGNAADASARLRHLLAAADVIAAEDTRRTRRLAADLGITLTARLLSHHEHNEQSRSADLIAAARAGQLVVVVSDAGMPSVSDPGFRLVEAALAEGVPVSSAPGPSAVLTALALSGLPTDRFCFEGFLPRKGGDRRRAFEALLHEPRTVVFFESPHRIASALADAAAVLGADRPACVARELTKRYEEVRRGTLAELAAWAQGDVRGEICLVIGPGEVKQSRVADVINEVEALVAGGMRLKDASRQVGEARGVSGRELYQEMLARKQA
ncbi:16S rRNA (cytidine(1402)-2'-O)-methyltransferase [Micrococcales bacterium 31B]|nr:16S rRNA (cytidine(1402)-2'-O)-methyltransferase [Micrococcales bacterium 31B]